MIPIMVTKYFKLRLFLKLPSSKTNVLKQYYAKLNTGNTNDNESAKEYFHFEEKSAIINGGASGIGLAIAREFLDRGVPCLTIIDINPEKGEYIENKLNKEYGDGKVQFFEADITNAKELDDVYRKAIQYNDIPEIVVNSAGIMNDSKWNKQLQTNLAGCAIATLLSMQYMAKSSKGFGGTIANIASVFGITPSCGYPLHSMTQFGICGLSKALGGGTHFHRTGVKIFALCAGLTDTPSLSEAPKHAINENFANEYLDEIKGMKVQKTKNVAKALANIVGKAKQGSTWLVEDDQKPYEIHYPGILPAKEKTEDENAENLVGNTTEKVVI